MGRYLVIAAAAFAYAWSAAGALAADATGTWLTEDGKAHVRIARCGAALCGSIVSLREPNDPQTGRPKSDIHNEDAGKRSRPLIGVAIILGMRPSGTPEQWKGRVYNAEDGKTYTGYITVTGPSSLKLQGCVLGGLICKSQTWSRSK